MFIANTNIDHKKLKVIEHWLGVNHVKSFGMHLGLPTNNHRDKNQVFKMLNRECGRCCKIGKRRSSQVG